MARPRRVRGVPASCQACGNASFQQIFEQFANGSLPPEPVDKGAEVMAMNLLRGKLVHASSVGGVARFAVAAVLLFTASIASAQLPGTREDPFNLPPEPEPARPGVAAPSDPLLPAPMPEPGPAPAPAPAPAPGGGEPSFESEPYVPQSTPAEEQIKLGQELMEQNRSELALQHFEEATKLAGDDSERADAFFQLGNALRMLERFDDAIDAYTAAIENAPDDGEAYLRRGIAWFYKGEYGIAWVDFDDASAAFLNKEPQAELWKGLAKARQGQWLDAVNSYATALQEDPNFALAYTNRGLGYLHLDSPEMAMHDFNQAIRHEPKNPVHYFRRGVAYTRMGRFADALKSYDRAIELHPEYAEALYNRGLLHRRAGNAAQASSDHQEAVKLNPKLESQG